MMNSRLPFNRKDLDYELDRIIGLLIETKVETRSTDIPTWEVARLVKGLFTLKNSLWTQGRYGTITAPASARPRAK